MDDFKRNINVSVDDGTDTPETTPVNSSFENTPSVTENPSVGSPSVNKPNTTKGKGKNMKFLSNKWTKVGLVLVILALIGGGFAYQMNSNNKLKKENQRLSNPQEAAKAETEALKNEVAQIIQLPNETPTIATVVDASKLKEQAFFANAENGDKVLLFAEAKKAILYRPSTKKIIEVAPINIGDSTKATTPAATPKK